MKLRWGMGPIGRLRREGRSALAFLALLGTGCAGRRDEPVPTPPLLVEVAFPIEREVADYEVFTARLQAVQSVQIKARVTGYLTKIGFKDGQEVKEGDILFEIDDRPYKATLDGAIAGVALQKASLTKATADLEIARNTEKLNPGAISKEDMVLRVGSRDEAAAALQSAEAALEQAQLNYDWCKVVAPISGRADRHFVDVGNLVSQDVTALTNIVSLKPIWAYFDVDENTAEQVQKLVQEGKLPSARAREIPVEMALGADDEFSRRGTTDFIANQLDPNTGSIQVRAVFPNEDGSLAAGMFGRIRISVAGPHTGLLVQDEAIGVDQGFRYLLVVNDQDVVEYRRVEVGQVFDGLREVERELTLVATDPSGKETTKSIEVLRTTDRVIVSGLQRARPGTKVIPKLVDMETMMAVATAGDTAKGDAAKEGAPAPAKDLKAEGK